MKVLNFIISIIALIMATIALDAIYFESVSKTCATTLDATLAIIAICTTLIVGTSVVDSIKMNQMDAKIKELESDAGLLKKKEKEIEVAVYISFGMALLNLQPKSAFNYFQKALVVAFKNENVNWIGYSIQCLENIPRLSKVRDGNCNKTAHYDIPDDITKSSIYHTFKKRIENVYKEINNTL